MQVHRSLDKLPEIKNAVLTIGTFDGVHCGHQRIINDLRKRAEAINGESVLLTFHPHPRLVINPADKTLRLLTTLDEKIALLDQFGIDHLIILPFSKAFSQTEPDVYIREVLVGPIRPRVIVIGYNHHFGKDRKGNIETLRKYAERYHYDVVEISKQEVEEIAVSSSKIRKAVHEGDIRLANKLLGHPYPLSGTVIKGQQIGKKLGYPTANIFISDSHKLIPPYGVYAVKVRPGNKEKGGMLYIGKRPTFDGQERSIEVNIFDFDEHIYGQFIRIEILDRIRGDMYFKDKNELARQMDSDKEETLRILKDHG